MSTPRSGPPPVQNHSHQQRHLHDPPQHQTQHWSVQPPPFPNKDPIPFETIFTDPFQDPLSFSLTPPAPPSQTTNNSPPQSHLSQLIPRTKLQQHALSQPPAQPSSQPQAPPPVSQSRQQLQHSLQQPQLQQPQLPQPQLQQPQLPQSQLPQSQLPQSQLPQPQLQQTQLQRSHLHPKVEPQLHRQFQQNLSTQTQPQAHDQLARHIHAHPPPYPQSKSQQPHAQLHRPLPLTDVDALTPAERRKLRIELRRGRMRARRPIAPPRPPLERSPNQLPVTAARPDTRPSAALDKKAARVIRNREVALKARQAAKTRMKNLEEENCSLKSRASTLEVENSTLKSQIEMLRKNTGSSSGSGGGGGVPWDGDLGLGSVVNAMTH